MRRVVLKIMLLMFPIAINAQSDTCNCCSASHQAFDFWVGEWEVRLADGSLAGHNTITKIQKDCILQEEWTNANANFTGRSWNFFNSGTGQWEQLWIDQNGSVLKLKGNRTGNQMVLSSDPFKDSEGLESRNRISWTLNADGTVRQLWERITSGKENQILFDGLYKKKAQ